MLNKYGKPRGTEIDFENLKPEIDSTDDEVFINIDEDNEIIECLLNLPQLEQMQNPINMQNIFNHQCNYPELMNPHLQYPATYPINNVSNIDIITLQDERIGRNQ